MVKTVSVHIVTYNSAADIADCLAAVRDQSYPIYEIIVIDNASQDDTVSVVEQVISNMPEQPITIVSNKQNIGFAPAHNQAIRMRNSDYVLVLNPDVTIGEHYVQLLVEQAELQRNVGSLTGKLLRKSNPELVDSTGLTMNKARRAFDRGAGDVASNWNESGFVFGVSGAAALYSRRMIDAISIQGQFFDESFFAYKEDVDVAWRANLLGWKSYYCADALAYHERGWKEGGRKRQSLFIRQMSYINRYKMIYKNDSRISILKNLLHILPYDIASNSYFLLREPKVLGAWGSFWKELSDLRVKRREILDKKMNKHK
ncbi:glycosyltransferase family 2 protein [Paenibacillus sediminis]|uniref:GT2 family glycosyltransferase n=1 Tax=Paenibacillus sediminis TaxID=664909 RepID=A0ABS4H249_9BACL|nr:glycosyltransferase family 2 protein [Paenibacillus sediminis]MBP1936593.1 GT2 family glycosyltransferase [Paenibacillus sediminis]